MCLWHSYQNTCTTTSASIQALPLGSAGRGSNHTAMSRDVSADGPTDKVLDEQDADGECDNLNNVEKVEDGYEADGEDNSEDEEWLDEDDSEGSYEGMDRIDDVIDDRPGQ
jgi:hypothetical protein